ncbi:MAG: alpha/beta hydrolase, partial [Pyrinomonadaceae bacterium]|nr:alpha/beta hydrolase [Sphingobacteriaceae bacterium]
MKTRIYIFSFLVLPLVFLNFGCKKNTSDDVPTNNYIKTSIQYKTVAGVPATLLSLDVYSYAQNESSKPVIIWVHGGGWRIGDKSNKLDNKLNLFNSLNYVLISVNYRLSPDPPEISNISRIKYPDHNNDVADAVKWVRNNIAAYGGDASKMVLLGHSAGAHLVSLTGTSQQFLPPGGFLLSMLKGIASIDTEGYDVPSQSAEELYQNAFGTDNNIQMQASPIYNVSSSFSYPGFFIAKRGTPARIALADAFIYKLRSVGVPVSQVNGSQYDHEGINVAIG